MQVNKSDIKFLQDNNLISSELIYDGAILQLYVNQLKIENDLIVERELIHHQAAVGILPVTNEGKAVLVEQYRAAAAANLLEIPAGLLDLDEFDKVESSQTGAARELEEETGYQAERWKELGTYYLSPGFLNEKITLFYATELTKVEEPLPQDEDEIIILKEFTKPEIKALLDNHKIQDLKTVFALNYWLNE